MTVVAAVGFWAFLAVILAIVTTVGMGRQGWQEIRHELRRRKSK